MDATWDSSCLIASTNDIDYMTSLGLESNLKTAATEKVFYYHRGLKDTNLQKPILVMLHGYPQTNFMWRHIIPLLPRDIPLFIPDLPGYGRSSPLHISHTKSALGTALLSTLHTLLSQSQTPSPHPIILVGHDRGARVGHRLTITPSPHFTLLGTILLDIIPGPSQWTKASTPSASVGFWHWSFLPNIDLATRMISAFGAENWIETNLTAWSGTNEAGLKSLRSEDAERVYANSFTYPHTIRASCDDYRASAFEEIDEHESDQKQGRKMEGDVLILYSSAFLVSRGKIEVWEDWMGKEGRLETKGLGNGVGHFLAEEAPAETAEAVTNFYSKHS